MFVLATMAEWVAMLVLVAGLVWAAATWKSRRREAVLVAVACALLLAIDLLWLPGFRWLASVLTRDSYTAYGQASGFAQFIQWLATGAAFGFLIYAALGKKTE